MARSIVALFGEAEKGELGTPFLIKNLPHLNDILGHPPKESRGIFFAIQFLLYQQTVIYIRVKEEGFSTKDYFKGVQHLHSKEPLPYLTALCLPGVGDAHILNATHLVTDTYKAFIITTEQDLYDYLTSFQLPSV